MEQIAPDETATAWYQVHRRQAFRFGAISAGIALVALSWPLILSFVFRSVQATLWMYGFAIVLDLVLVVLWLARAIGYSRRAARGELFEITTSGLQKRDK